MILLFLDTGYSETDYYILSTSFLTGSDDDADDDDDDDGVQENVLESVSSAGLSGQLPLRVVGWGSLSQGGLHLRLQ